MTSSVSLIAELDLAVQAASPQKRMAALKGVTDIFVSAADRFTEAQVSVFDDVLRHLMKDVQTKALIELSRRIAPIANVPIGVINHLARHEDILVAAPALALSPRLTSGDLIEIAQTKSQEHLCWISRRAKLDQDVTDILIERGDSQVTHTLAKNNGARFSEMGYATIVQRAKNDDSLAERIGMRIDLPSSLLQELVLKAGEAVRQRLLAIVPVERHEEITRVVASASKQLIREHAVARDYAAAAQRVLRMQQQNQLNAATIGRFARLRKYEEMVVGLSALCEAPIGLIEQLMQNVRHDPVLIACKAADIHWPVAEDILMHRFAHHSIAAEDLHQAKIDFLKLTNSTAKRILRFWQAQGGLGAIRQENRSGSTTTTLH